MEELPEYQVCPKCGKRSTPYVKRCWNCGAYFFEDDEILEKQNKSIETDNTTEEYCDLENIEPESITPCKIANMNFTDQMFAYSLLFKGEMVLEFCDCETCKKAYSDLQKFFDEIYNTSDKTKIPEKIKGTVFDLSKFGL